MKEACLNDILLSGPVFVAPEIEKEIKVGQHSRCPSKATFKSFPNPTPPPALKKIFLSLQIN